MRIFERLVCKQELSPVLKNEVGPDQFAYMEGHSTSYAKSYDINPYIINWVISFLCDCQQRVVVDGVVTKFLNINRGVSQGTVLGPILFSIMVNDIKPVSPSSLLIKYADDITVSVPIKSSPGQIDPSHQAVCSI